MGPQALTNVVLVVIKVPKTFSFHNRSSLNFAHRLGTIFSTITQCQIFK